MESRRTKDGASRLKAKNVVIWRRSLTSRDMHHHVCFTWLKESDQIILPLLSGSKHGLLHAVQNFV